MFLQEVRMKFAAVSAVLASVCVFISGCVQEHLIMDGKESFHVAKETDKGRAAKHRAAIAVRLIQTGQASLAKSNLQKGLELDPDCFECKLAFAYYYQVVGEKTHAYNAFNSLMSEYGDHGEVYNNYGVFLCSENKFSEAYQMFERAVTTPSFSMADDTLVQASLCAAKQGDDDRAIKYIDRSLDYDAVNTVALMQRANLALNKGDLTTAKAMMNRYSHLTPDTPESLFIKLRIAEGNNEIEKAEEIGNRLVDMYPDSVQAKKYQQNDY